MRAAAILTAAAFVAILGAGGGFVAAQVLIATGYERDHVLSNGWRLYRPPQDANIVTHALRHAAEAANRLGVQPPDVTATFATAKDSEGRALSGRSRYTLHMDRRALPPVDGFWSLALLDANGGLVTGSDRHSISTLTPDLLRNPDGSIDIVIASTPPDDPRTNWLPAPDGPFSLLLRAYAPRPAISERRWTPPRVERRETAA